MNRIESASVLHRVVARAFGLVIDTLGHSTDASRRPDRSPVTPWAGAALLRGVGPHSFGTRAEPSAQTENRNQLGQRI